MILDVHKAMEDPSSVGHWLGYALRTGCYDFLSCHRNFLPWLLPRLLLQDRGLGESLRESLDTLFQWPPVCTNPQSCKTLR